MFQPRKTGGVAEAEIPADPVRAVRRHGEPDFFRTAEEILHQFVLEGQVRHDLPHPLATEGFVVFENGVQGGVRPVDEGPGVHVAEGEKAVGMRRDHIENVLVGLGQVDFRIDHGQERPHLDPVLVVARDELVGAVKLSHKGQGPAVGVGVDVDIFHFRRSFYLRIL